MGQHLTNTGWVVTGTADNAAATATQAAIPGQCFYVTGFDVSYSTALTGVKQHTLKYTPTENAAEVTLTFNINYTVSDGHVTFPVPIRCALNSRLLLTAAASGTGGNVSQAHLYGWTL